MPNHDCQTKEREKQIEDISLEDFPKKFDDYKAEKFKASIYGASNISIKTIIMILILILIVIMLIIIIYILYYDKNVLGIFIY